MKTTATNLKVRQLLTDVRDESLEIKPPFQRRLVWKNRDKCNFIQTVLDGYPFPEIYVATGELDLETGEGTQLLVDGQQRISTLYEYFNGADDLKLPSYIPRYVDLSKEIQNQFLQYDVVVRDLGALSDQEIREVFKRINSTSYPLNAMELDNSRFDGAFKSIAEEIAEEDFFSRHRIFSANQIRRMQDTRFVLRYMVTVMSTYFNQDSEIERFLEIYNEEFQDAEKMRRDTRDAFSFIEGCDFGPSARVWGLADIFTLMVETYWAFKRDGLEMNPVKVSRKLKEFYNLVNESANALDANQDAAKYHRSALQGSNSRSNRITRGKIIAEILRG